MELLCVGIIVVGILVAALPLIIVAIKVIGGCLLLLLAGALIVGLAQSCSGEISSSYTRPSGQQSASYTRPTRTHRPLPTQTARPTRTPRPTKTPLPTHTPTPLPTDHARLAYRISAPNNISLEYNSADGSGILHWEASRWMPTRPGDSNTIKYDILVIYPDSTSGPFTTQDTSYTFPFLNAHSTGGIRVEVEAVGIIRVGPYDYDRRSGSAETTWSPTPTPTVTPYPSEDDIWTAVADHADAVDILQVSIRDNVAKIDYKFISWLAVPNEDIAEEAAFKIICALRQYHPRAIPYELQLVGQGWHEDEYGRNFTVPTVELHIPAPAVNDINCESEPERIDWQKIASFYDL